MQKTLQLMRQYCLSDTRNVRDLSTEELVFHYQSSGDDLDLAQVYCRCYPFMLKVCSGFKSISWEDKASISVTECERAMQSYKSDNNTKFYSWLTTILTRHLISMSNKVQRRIDSGYMEVPFTCDNEDCKNGDAEYGIPQLSNKLVWDSAQKYNEIDFKIAFSQLLNCGVLKKDELAALLGCYYDLQDKQIAEKLDVSQCQLYWARKRVKQLLTNNTQLYNMVFGV